MSPAAFASRLIVGKADDPPTSSVPGRTGPRGPGAELHGPYWDGRGDSSRHQ